MKLTNDDGCESPNNEKLVKSRQRVAEYGEVLTGKREVNAMLDLVMQETERIESRFLEPACGTGNFLAEILRRKLEVVKKRYAKSQFEFERNAIIAVSSIYGIDIQSDNVQDCRDRLFGIFESVYLELFKNNTNDDCRASVNYILSCNIIHGDALNLQTEGDNPQPIVFSEWSPINGSLIQRRDFTFHSILQNESLNELEVFSYISDQGEEVYIPTPICEYPPIHFLKLGSGMSPIVETSSRRFNVETTSCHLQNDKLQDEDSPNSRQDDLSTSNDELL